MGLLHNWFPVDVGVHVFFLHHDFEEFASGVGVGEGDVYRIRGFKGSSSSSRRRIGGLQILLSSLLMMARSRSQGRFVAPRTMMFFGFPSDSSPSSALLAPSIWTNSSDLTLRG